MAPTLTRRGEGVLAVAVLAALLGWGFGGRSLNAVVMPAVALLAGTGAYAWWLDEPRIVREAPTYGHQGETRRVELRVEAGHGYPAHVADDVGEGLRGESAHQTIADGRRLGYEIDLADRGVHDVGPCRVVATDPLGLWIRRFEGTETHTITVFPRIPGLGGTAQLLEGYVGLADERERFHGVREYARGDPLRDVNWKASAKRPRELVVTEFAGEGASDRVTVAVESSSRRTDTAAAVAASVAVHLLDGGVSVGLRTPDAAIEPAHGDPHRRRLLSALATFDGDRLSAGDREDAAIVVSAPEGGEHVVVDVDGETRRYAGAIDGERDERREAENPREGAREDAREVSA